MEELGLFYSLSLWLFYTHTFNTLMQNNKPPAVTAAASHWFFLLLPRLLRSLIGLKRVIINAAHFLVMKNKEFYRFYQTEPFLETVRGGKEGHLCCCVIVWKSCIFFSLCKYLFHFLRYVFHFEGWQACYSRLSASAHSNRAGPDRAEVLSASSRCFHLLCLPPQSPLHHPVLLIAFSFPLPGTWFCSTPSSRSGCVWWPCWSTRSGCGCLRRMDRPSRCSWALSGALPVKWVRRYLR